MYLEISCISQVHFERVALNRSACLAKIVVRLSLSQGYKYFCVWESDVSFSADAPVSLILLSRGRACLQTCLCLPCHGTSSLLSSDDALLSRLCLMFGSFFSFFGPLPP